jgi:hypothetical protein
MIANSPTLPAKSRSTAGVSPDNISVDPMSTAMDGGPLVFADIALVHLMIVDSDVMGARIEYSAVGSVSGSCCELRHSHFPL